MLLILLMHK